MVQPGEVAELVHEGRVELGGRQLEVVAAVHAVLVHAVHDGDAGDDLAACVGGARTGEADDRRILAEVLEQRAIHVVDDRALVAVEAGALHGVELRRRVHVAVA